MSKEEHAALCAEVARAVAAFQDASGLVDEAAAATLGVNRTDLHFLGVLCADGPLSPSQLAQRAGLSPAATTTALDRLERAGYARRVRHPEDRRGVVVEVTAEARRLIDAMYAPIEQAGLLRLARYTVEELHFLRDFLDEGRAFQSAQAARIRAIAPRRASSARSHR